MNMKKKYILVSDVDTIIFETNDRKALCDFMISDLKEFGYFNVENMSITFDEFINFYEEVCETLLYIRKH